MDCVRLDTRTVAGRSSSLSEIMQIVTLTVRVKHLCEDAHTPKGICGASFQERRSERSACALPLTLLHDDAVSQNAAGPTAPGKEQCVARLSLVVKRSRSCWETSLCCVWCSRRRMCRDGRVGFAKAASWLTETLTAHWETLQSNVASRCAALTGCRCRHSRLMPLSGVSADCASTLGSVCGKCGPLARMFASRASPALLCVPRDL